MIDDAVELASSLEWIDTDVEHDPVVVDARGRLVRVKVEALQLRETPNTPSSSAPTELVEPSEASPQARSRLERIMAVDRPYATFWRQKRRWLRACGVLLLAYFPAGYLAYQLERLIGGAVPVALATFYLVALALAVSFFSAVVFRCPRCGALFIRNKTWANPAATHCMNCGLPRGAPFDPDAPEDTAGPRPGGDADEHLAREAALQAQAETYRIDPASPAVPCRSTDRHLAPLDRDARRARLRMRLHLAAALSAQGAPLALVALLVSFAFEPSGTGLARTMLFSTLFALGLIGLVHMVVLQFHLMKNPQVPPDDRESLAARLLYT